MRLNINLATKPYQDVRRILLQWGGLVLLLALATAALLWTAVGSWRESREVNQKIAVLRAEIAVLDHQQADAIALLERKDNSAVVEDSRFLNGLIARKSFSWTLAFMQLEKILPPRLHVVSITPVLQPATNTIEVQLTVGGTSREAAIELVKRLEQSPSFRNARIADESSVSGRDTSDTITFQLAATYIPQHGVAAPYAAAATEAPAPAPAAEKPDKSEKKAARTGGAR